MKEYLLIGAVVLAAWAGYHFSAWQRANEYVVPACFAK